MPAIALRKLVVVVQVEEIFREGGPPKDAPVEEIQGFMEDLKPLGLTMARKLLAALDGDPAQIEGDGKGGPGTRLDMPITHVDASYVRRHSDAIEVGVADAPRASELALVLAMTTEPRVHARAGGLKASDIKGEDGLR